MSWKTRLASGAVTLKPSLTGLRGHPLRETFATLALKVILRNSAMQRGVMSVTRIRGEGGFMTCTTSHPAIPKDVKRLNSSWKTFFEWLSTSAKGKKVAIFQNHESFNSILTKIEQVFLVNLIKIQFINNWYLDLLIHWLSKLSYVIVAWMVIWKHCVSSTIVWN